jgi:hypothetical protein
MEVNLYEISKSSKKIPTISDISLFDINHLEEMLKLMNDLKTNEALSIKCQETRIFEVGVIVGIRESLKKINLTSLDILGLKLRSDEVKILAKILEDHKNTLKTVKIDIGNLDAKLIIEALSKAIKLEDLIIIGDVNAKELEQIAKIKELAEKRKIPNLFLTSPRADTQEDMISAISP